MKGNTAASSQEAPSNYRSQITTVTKACQAQLGDKRKSIKSFHNTRLICTQMNKSWCFSAFRADDGHGRRVKTSSSLPYLTAFDLRRSVRRHYRFGCGDQLFLSTPLLLSCSAINLERSMPGLACQSS